MLFTQSPHCCYQQSLNGAAADKFRELWNHWKFTTEAAAMFISLYFFTPPIPTHLFYAEMFASKASPLKSLPFLLPLTSIWALSIQRKVRKEGIVIPGTNIDKCYCSSISLMIWIHMGGYTVLRTEHKCTSVKMNSFQGDGDLKYSVFA